ncbi:MAG: DUF4105 domain-containing protein [Calditrichaceae bacterium]|nr:DUF4105 domain-containing protein [Calditrichaceae bacterium]
MAEEPWATGQSKADDLRIKLVTFGPGEDIPSWWGHGGIIVEDVGKRRARIYNFGLYSFDKGMLTKFAMGRLIFSVGDFSVPGYLYYYQQLDRDVRIQTLHIPPEKKLQMAQLLAMNVLPQNREYLYHHYYDNCSTRLRDIINAAVDGALYKATDKPARMTLRGHTKRYTGHCFPMELLLMFLMGDEIDKPIKQWDEMFLPDELEKYVGELMIPDTNDTMRPLVSDRYIFYKSDQNPVYDEIPVHWPLAVLSGLVIGFLAITIVFWLRSSLSSWARVMYGIYLTMIGIVLGIPGLFLAVVSSFTDHSVTYYNENLIFVNPLTFIFIMVGVAIARNKNRGWIWLDRLWVIHIILLTITIALKVIPAFDQDNFLVIAFVVPIFILNMYAVKLIPKTKKVQYTY